jgi:hypothetical protein
MLDDFNVDGNIESEDDWFGDQYNVQLSQKNPSKVSKAMTIEVSSPLSPRTFTNTVLFAETELEWSRYLFDT